MDPSSSQPPVAFGFLTVLEDDLHGLFGGYLVVSERGRPLEFRCSTPIRANRAQQILYGPTLRSYLLAEVLGQALLAGTQTAVVSILTDEQEMLELALLCREEVWWVSAAATSAPGTGSGPGEQGLVASNLRPPDRIGPGDTGPGDTGLRDTGLGAERAPAGLRWGLPLEIGGRTLRPAVTLAGQKGSLTDSLTHLATCIDLAEPFDRVRAALREAGQIPETASEPAQNHASAA